MTMNSVNTNVGAMVALQNLNSTTSELNMVQGRINTGKKITSAKDNGAIWAIAQSQRSDSQGINPVKESLQRGISTVDVAMAAGERVSDLLIQMKEKALAASDTGLNTESREALEADYVSLAKQITTVVDNASFNGVNMLKGAALADAGTSVRALANSKATSTIEVKGVNLQLAAAATAAVVDNTATRDIDETRAVGDANFVTGFAGINIAVGANPFTGATAIAADTTTGAPAVSAGERDANRAKQLVGDLDKAISFVSEKLAALGTGSNALSSHLNFMSKLQDSLDAGVGSLVDADLAKESARLQALQTKQQLGIQALSIANSSSGILLGLFR